MKKVKHKLIIVTMVISLVTAIIITVTMTLKSIQTNNKLLDNLNVENCINLVKAIDLSNCVNLETVKAKGSSLTSLQFPMGGHLTNLELPGTFTNLTIRN